MAFCFTSVVLIFFFNTWYSIDIFNLLSTISDLSSDFVVNFQYSLISGKWINSTCRLTHNCCRVLCIFDTIHIFYLHVTICWISKSIAPLLRLNIFDARRQFLLVLWGALNHEWQAYLMDPPPEILFGKFTVL